MMGFLAIAVVVIAVVCFLEHDRMEYWDLVAKTRPWNDPYEGARAKGLVYSWKHGWTLSRGWKLALCIAALKAFGVEVSA